MWICFVGSSSASAAIQQHSQVFWRLIFTRAVEPSLWCSNLIDHCTDRVASSHDDQNPICHGIQRLKKRVHHTMIVTRSVVIFHVDMFVKFCIVCDNYVDEFKAWLRWRTRMTELCVQHSRAIWVLSTSRNAVWLICWQNMVACSIITKMSFFRSSRMLFHWTRLMVGIFRSWAYQVAGQWCDWTWR